MKQYKTNYIKLLISLFTTVLLFFNCQEEYNFENQELRNNSYYKSRFLSLKQIPKIKEYLYKKIPQNILTKVTSGTILNEEQILEVVDTLGNKSYSINFRMNDTPEGTFLNLVVGRNLQGELKEPFVLRYVCDDEYKQEFINQNYNINYFSGKINLHRYTDFFNKNLASRDDEICPPLFDNDGNIVFCDNTGANFTGGGNNGDPYDNNNNTGWNPIDNYGDTGLGSDTDFSSSSDECSFTITNNGPCDSGGTSVHPPHLCGSGTGVQYVVIIDCSGVRNPNRTTKSNCECPDNIDLAGINSTEDKSLAILKKIKSDELDVCPNEILTNLKRLSGNNIANVLSRFGNPTSVYDWEVKSGTPTNVGNSAETNWAIDSDNNAITNSFLTVIDTSYVNRATNLSIARTILHEAIHAYILSYTEELINDPNTFFNFQNNFPVVWNFFIAKKNGIEVGDIEDAHHREMAESFVEIIGSALAEYDNNQQDGSYYEALAWGALMDTDTFDRAIGPGGYMTQSEQESILIINNQEDTNGPLAKGSVCP